MIPWCAVEQANWGTFNAVPVVAAEFGTNGVAVVLLNRQGTVSAERGSLQDQQQQWLPLPNRTAGWQRGSARLRRSASRLSTWVVTWVVLSLAAAAPAFGQQFVDKVFKDEQGTHKYSVFVPAGLSPSRPAPAILFLHGAGERGTDGVLPRQIGLGPYLKAWGSRLPFVVVFPQAVGSDGRLLTPWLAGKPDSNRALAILAEVQKSYPIDAQRIALVGWSMGGYGAWSLGAAHPEKWSAVAALSGGGDPQQVAALKDTPVWALHGRLDPLVPASESQTMVTALQNAGGNVTYTEIPDAGHDLFAATFGDPGFFAWVANPKTAPARLSPVPTAMRVESPPFVPALSIPQAVGIRLGNEALNALAYSAPSQVPPGMLSGRLNDMFDSTSVRGRSFSIRFSGISYSGALERVVIQAVGTNRLRIQLGLRNILLSIASTSISGARHSAQAGTINIGIGHNQTVWLTLDTTPVIENRRLRLRLAGTSFSIPSNSYYVTQPAGVSVQGFGITQEMVVNGLISGLYGARARIEGEVRNIAPSLMSQMEAQFQLTDPGPIVAGFWPLPVYQPRLTAYPEQISTDAQGISLVMGVTAAEMIPRSSRPTVVPTSAPAGVQLRQLTGDGLSVAVAPQVLQPLTQQLIEAGLARIHLLDIPEKSFGELAQRSFLETVLPDLKRFPADMPIRAELVMAAPLQVGTVDLNGKVAVASGANSGAGAGTLPVSAEAAGDLPLRFQLPKLQVQIAIQPDGSDGAWKPYAEFELAVDEQVAARIEKPTHTRRVLGMYWQSERSLSGTGRFAPDAPVEDKTIQSDLFAEAFQKSWHAWTGRGAAARVNVPDIRFGDAPLRLQQIALDQQVLQGQFRVPTVKLTNLSPEVFVYETKGPYSGWGGPYRLEPGKSHEYQIPYSLTYRRRVGGTSEVYTLIPGSHSEYRVPLSGGAPRLFQAREPQPEAVSTTTDAPAAADLSISPQTLSTTRSADLPLVVPSIAE
jgi:pimeloyl-ACP methyl ester carboxylesterase